MERRELLSLSGLAALAGALGQAGGAEAQESGGKNVPPVAKILRIWADDAGQSHVDWLTISPKAKPIPVTSMRLRPPETEFVDWHKSGPAMSITITGHLEVEVTDGSKATVPTGGIAFLDDRKGNGKGHITRPRGVINLFLETPPGFDVVAWARGD